jgi:transcriptional regulator with XRE-family HTH domain
MAKRPLAAQKNRELQIHLGAVVRKCRTEMGLTQEELASRADLHRTYLADIERGARNVTLRILAKLAKTLHITLADLFLGSAGIAHQENPGSDDGALTAAREILLVEGNAAAAASTARALKRARVANPIHIVRNGEAALDYLGGTGRYAVRKPPRPQLIVVDLNLPRMSGVEFLRRLKAGTVTRHIPVLVLSDSLAPSPAAKRRVS